jgi:Lipase.
MFFLALRYSFYSHLVCILLQKMTKELLKLLDCNVIVVDWGNGSGPPYPQAVANIRVVGAMTAHLINNLIVSTVIYITNCTYA